MERCVERGIGLDLCEEGQLVVCRCVLEGLDHQVAMLAREPVPEYLKALYPNETLEFGVGYMIPKAFDRRLRDIVPSAVAEAARQTGVARR